MDVVSTEARGLEALIVVTFGKKEEMGIKCVCVLSPVQLFATQWTAAGYSVRGVSQAWILEWFAISSS